MSRSLLPSFSHRAECGGGAVRWLKSPAARPHGKMQHKHPSRRHLRVPRAAGPIDWILPWWFQVSISYQHQPIFDPVVFFLPIPNLISHPFRIDLGDDYPSFRRYGEINFFNRNSITEPARKLDATTSNGKQVTYFFPRSESKSIDLETMVFFFLSFSSLMNHWNQAFTVTLLNEQICTRAGAVSPSMRCFLFICFSVPLVLLIGWGQRSVALK